MDYFDTMTHSLVLDLKKKKTFLINFNGVIEVSFFLRE